MKHPPVYIYYLAILCALPIERQAMEACLDDVYHPSYKVPHDPMVYTLGRIGKHAVVITSLYAYGTSQSATAAANIRRSFPNVRTCLMVGIGGGVPYLNGKDIHLGDVVVSVPHGSNSGILSYDCGKDVEGVGFQLNSATERPPQSLLLAVGQLEAGSWPKLTAMVEELVSSGTIHSSFRSPGRETDILFEPDAVHSPVSTSDDSCHVACQHLPQRLRAPREDDHPVVYHGLVASGNGVIKSATRCQELAHKYGILCFEMEGAGVTKSLDCLIIRGISDYSDSHKAKHWQKYAALVAACYAKELLLWVPPQALRLVAHESPTKTYWHVPYIRPPTIYGLQEQRKHLHEFLTSKDHRGQYLLVDGPSGCGKTILVSHAVHAARDTTTVVWLSARHPEYWKLNIIELAIYLEQPYDYNDLDKTLLGLLDLIERRAEKPWILVVDDSDKCQDMISKLDQQNKLAPVIHRRAVIVAKGTVGSIPQSQFPVKLVQLQYLWGREGQLFLEEYLADDSLFEDGSQCSELVEMMAETPIYLAQCAAFMLEQWIPISKLIEYLNSVDLGARYEEMGFLRKGIPECAVKLHALILQLIKTDKTLSLFAKCAMFLGVQGIPIGQIPLQQKDLNIFVNMLVRYNVAQRTRDQTLEFYGVTHSMLLDLLYDSDATEKYDCAIDNIMQLAPRSGGHNLIDVHRITFQGMCLVDAWEVSEEKKVYVLVHLQNLFVKARAYQEVVSIANRVREAYNEDNTVKMELFKEAHGCALNMATACYKLGKYNLARHVVDLLAPFTNQSDLVFQRVNRYLYGMSFPSRQPVEHSLDQDIRLYIPFDFPRDCITPS